VRAIAFLALLSALLAAYGPALTGGMLWDDDVHVTPPELRSADGLRRILLEPGATQQYYPLLYGAFWLEHRLWGDATLGYHLLNVLLHALSAFLLGLLLDRLKVPGAWLAAGLFALHPVAVESVAWISEQKNTQSTAFLLAAALAYVAFDESRSRRQWLLATLLFAGALGSKSATVTLPAALLVVLWWRRGRLEPKRDVVPLRPWFALSGLMAATTVLVERRLISAVHEDWSLGAAERLLLAGRAVLFYLGKLVWPADLAFVYPRWRIDTGDASAWLWPVAAAALTVALWALRARTRAPLAAWLLYAGTLAPVLGFFDVYVFRYSYVADHFQYVPMTAMCALAAAGLARAGARLPRGAALAGAAALLAVLGARSREEAAEYRGAEVHYRAILADNPDAFLARNNLGVLLLDTGREEEAVGMFEAGLATRPDSSELHHNLANALSASGRVAEAVPHLEEALRLQPTLAEAANNLCNALRRLGRAAEAIPRCERALALRPGFAEAENNLGAALVAAGRAEEALPHFERALALDPALVEARKNAGLALARLGRLPEAIALHEAAIAGERGAVAATDLGNLLLAAGRPEDAIPRFRTALSRAGGDADALNGLGAALASLGRLEEARASLEAAVAARPLSASAQRNLGNVLLELGRAEEAIPHLEEAARLQPGSPEGLASLGRALSRAGRHGEAVRRFAEAADLSPSDPDLAFNLAVALARAGRTGEARSAAGEALRLRPTHERARALLVSLARGSGPP